MGDRVAGVSGAAAGCQECGLPRRSSLGAVRRAWTSGSSGASTLMPAHTLALLPLSWASFRPGYRLNGTLPGAPPAPPPAGAVGRR